MKSLFFSMLIVASTVYGAASDAQTTRGKKTTIIRWDKPEKRQFAVSSAGWGCGDFPFDVEEGTLLLYTNTPLSATDHNQVVAKVFFDIFLSQLSFRKTPSIFSESDLVAFCRTVITKVNDNLPFWDHLQNRVLRYILAVKVGEATLLTKVDASGHKVDKVLPELPEGEALQNIPWERNKIVYIDDSDHDYNIILGPAYKTAAGTSSSGIFMPY